MARRKKLSTTIGSENYAFLRRLVRTRKAASLAEAVDRAVEQARMAENRARLARDTAAYFQRLSPGALADEATLEAALDHAAGELDFDQP